MPKENLRIDLLGTSFSIRTDEDPAYLRRLLDRLTRVLERTRIETGLSDPVKIAIVSGIVLCDELEKSRKDAGLFDSAESERITLNLIARIDQALKE